MSKRNMPRRPAMLDAVTAEAILGDEDTAARSEVAHASAQAFLPSGGDGTSPEIVERLVELVDTGRLDDLAQLWDGSPHDTLPGALWRLYLLSHWLRRSREKIEEIHKRGRQRIEGGPDTGEIAAQLANVFSGRFQGNLDVVLENCALYMKTVATGAALEGQWITADDDDLAFHITRRHGALITTARELQEAASMYRSASLE